MRRTTPRPGRSRAIARCSSCRRRAAASAQITVPAVPLPRTGRRASPGSTAGDGRGARALLGVRARLRARAPARASLPRRHTQFVQQRDAATWARATPTARTRRRASIRSRRSCSTTRSATASSSPARWRCCCGWAVFRRGSRPASRPGTFDKSAQPLRRHRHRRACLGRGVVPALRLGALRPDAGRRARARRPRPAAARAACGRLRRNDAGRPGAQARADAGQQPGEHAVHGGGSLAWLIVARDRRAAGADRAGAPRSRRAGATPRSDELLAELERALARTGRPRRGRGHAGSARAPLPRLATDAVAYVRAIRMMRFGGGGEPPTRPSGERSRRSFVSA